MGCMHIQPSTSLRFPDHVTGSLCNSLKGRVRVHTAVKPWQRRLSRDRDS